MIYIKRICDNCSKEYMADNRNLKRGWGFCCSKSCAAKKREKGKPSYNKERVKTNNIKRELWNAQSLVGDKITGYTSEGYRIIEGTAYNEWDEPVYEVCPYLADENEGWDGHKGMG